MSAVAAPPLRARLGWTAAAAAVVATFIALGLLSEAFAPAPSGPAGSALSTTPAGVAAWAQLLAANGHPVQAVREPLDTAALPPAGTLAIIAAGPLTPAQAAHVRAFATGGGTVIVAGGALAQTAGALLGSAPQLRAGGPHTATPVGSGPEIAGVHEVTSAGGASLGPGPGALLAGDGGVLLAGRALGAGRVELLADASPVQNGLLASRDNAQLALDLAGAPGRPVAFAESLHGFTTASGLAAVPTRWWWFAVGLALAGALWAVGRGRRLGAPEPEGEPPAPARSAYVDALAAALVRAREPEALPGPTSKLPASVGGK